MDQDPPTIYNMQEVPTFRENVLKPYLTHLHETGIKHNEKSLEDYEYIKHEKYDPILLNFAKFLCLYNTYADNNAFIGKINVFDTHRSCNLYDANKSISKALKITGASPYLELMYKHRVAENSIFEIITEPFKAGISYNKKTNKYIVAVNSADCGIRHSYIRYGCFGPVSIFDGETVDQLLNCYTFEQFKKTAEKTNMYSDLLRIIYSYAIV